MIWGKLIGALLGLKGGILGVVIGLAVGHWVDLKIARGFRRQAQAPAGFLKETVFATAVISLAAKLAKADGAVSRAEVDAFKAECRFPPSERELVATIFDTAKQSPDGWEIHARNLAESFSDEPAVLSEVLDMLHHVALADGRLHPAERAFLTGVAGIFGFPGRQFAEERSGVSAAEGDAYMILGVERSASMAEIKAAWRRLSREHHPDILTARGMPEDFVARASRKMAAINAAYDRIRSERGEA